MQKKKVNYYAIYNTRLGLGLKRSFVLPLRVTIVVAVAWIGASFWRLGRVRRNVYFAPLMMLKTITLPRQARDKHGKRLKQDVSAGVAVRLRERACTRTPPFSVSFAIRSLGALSNRTNLRETATARDRPIG
jgi:hypothetical protein